MFWKSILEGIGTFFTHWEIWISVLVYGIIFIFYFVSFGFAVSRNSESGKTEIIGCLTNMIAGPILQGILVAFMVTLLLPILSRGDDFLPFQFISNNLWLIIKAGLISMGITILLTFLPFLGQLIANTPGTTIFVQGAIVFQMLVNSILIEILQELNSQTNIYPNFWTIIGFLVLSIIIVYVLSMMISFMLTAIGLLKDNDDGSASFIIGNFVGVIPGILCLCIYCAYVRLTIIGLSSVTTSL